MTEQWFRCNRCKKLQQISTKYECSSCAWWCDDCIGKSVELMGNEPFVVFRPVSDQIYAPHKSP